MTINRKISNLSSKVYVLENMRGYWWRKIHLDFLLQGRKLTVFSDYVVT